MNKDIEINDFSVARMAENERTEFYDELKCLAEEIKKREIVELFKQSKFINYNKWSIIPIIFPLCVYYKRTLSIDWLNKNIDFSRTSSKDVLMANMLKLELETDIVPKNWITPKNLLPVLCDHLNATKKYVTEHPDCVEEIMYDTIETLNSSSLAVLTYLYENNYLDDYGTSTIFDKFVSAYHHRHVFVKREEDLMKAHYIIAKRNPSVEDLLESYPSGADYEICELFASYLNDTDAKKYLMNVMIRIDEEINYSELDSRNAIDTLFFSAMKLGISGKKLCSKILSIDKKMVKDYIRDYENFLQSYEDRKKI